MKSSYDVSLEIQDADYEVVDSRPTPNPARTIPVNPMASHAKQVRAKQQNAPTIVYTLGGLFDQILRQPFRLPRALEHHYIDNPEKLSTLKDEYWHLANAHLCLSMFPDTVIDTDYFRWLMIPEFPLPNRWTKQATPLLIVQPGLNEQITLRKPDYFYCDQKLFLYGGSKPEHIYYDEGFNNLHHAGWARISWHIEKWQPKMNVLSGHNILSILEGLYKFFHTAK